MVGGTETELFRWPSARLYLLDGDERALLQRGSFTLFLTMHSLSPHLVAVEATVSDVQWPVGKDGKVSFAHDKVHSITFTLQQGLIYELVLDEKEGFSIQMDRLEQLLRIYAKFDYSGTKANRNKSLGEVEDERKSSQDMAGRMRTLLDQRSCNYSRFESSTNGAELDKEALQLTLAGSTGGRLWPHAGMHQDHDMMTSGSSGGTVPGASRQIMKRMNQARRISAVAKLFSKALERGAIRPERHIEQYAVPDQRQGGGTGIVTAVADVDMVEKVVELVEKRTTLGEVVRQEKGRRLRGSWTLNEVGLHLLLKAVVAANMIANSQNTITYQHLNPKTP